jgi:hypothetical protein
MSFVPATQRAMEAFDRENTFLRAMLGVASWLARFDRVLTPGSSPRAQQPAPQPELSDQLLYALLGAVKLKLDVEAVLARMLAETADREQTERSPVPVVRGSWLR